jgi:hypothetical protein
MNGAPRLRSAVPVFAAIALAFLISSGAASAAPAPPRAWVPGAPFVGLFAYPAVASAKCGKTKGLVCSEVDVPLDRTGAVAGTIPLHVEVLPSQGVQRGVMFLVAGGPGQGSARTFDLAKCFIRSNLPIVPTSGWLHRSVGAKGGWVIGEPTTQWTDNSNESWLTAGPRAEICA